VSNGVAQDIAEGDRIAVVVHSSNWVSTTTEEGGREKERYFHGTCLRMHLDYVPKWLVGRHRYLLHGGRYCDIPDIGIWAHRLCWKKSTDNTTSGNFTRTKKQHEVTWLRKRRQTMHRHLHTHKNTTASRNKIKITYRLFLHVQPTVLYASAMGDPCVPIEANATGEAEN
jgi:hypothetical protein